MPLWSIFSASNMDPVHRSNIKRKMYLKRGDTNFEIGKSN